MAQIPANKLFKNFNSTQGMTSIRIILRMKDATRKMEVRAALRQLIQQIEQELATVNP